MIIIGVDYHPEFQQLASVDTETGEFKEARLQNPEQAEQFYRELAARGAQVRIGMEASGHARWLERLLGELHFELWIGDADEICSKRVRKTRGDNRLMIIVRLLSPELLVGLAPPTLLGPGSRHCHGINITH